MKQKMFGLPLAVLVVIGCSHGPRPIDPLATAPSTHDEVYRFVQGYMEAANHSDLETIMSMVLHRPDILSVANGEVTSGWDAIQDQVKRLNSVPADLHVTLTGDPLQYQLAPDSVLVVAPYTLRVTGGDQAVALEAVTTLVLVKQDGAWKVLHEHNSARCPKGEGSGPNEGQ